MASEHTRSTGRNNNTPQDTSTSNASTKPAFKHNRGAPASENKNKRSFSCRVLKSAYSLPRRALRAANSILGLLIQGNEIIATSLATGIDPRTQVPITSSISASCPLDIDKSDLHHDAIPSIRRVPPHNNLKGAFCSTGLDLAPQLESKKADAGASQVKLAETPARTAHNVYTPQEAQDSVTSGDMAYQPQIDFPPPQTRRAFAIHSKHERATEELVSTHMSTVASYMREKRRLDQEIMQHPLERDQILQEQKCLLNALQVEEDRFVYAGRRLASRLLDELNNTQLHWEAAMPNLVSSDTPQDPPFINISYNPQSPTQPISTTPSFYSSPPAAGPLSQISTTPVGDPPAIELFSSPLSLPSAGSTIVPHHARTPSPHTAHPSLDESYSSSPYEVMEIQHPFLRQGLATEEFHKLDIFPTPHPRGRQVQYSTKSLRTGSSGAKLDDDYEMSPCAGRQLRREMRRSVQYDWRKSHDEEQDDEIF